MEEHTAHRAPATARQMGAIAPLVAVTEHRAVRTTRPVADTARPTEAIGLHVAVTERRVARTTLLAEVPTPRAGLTPRHEVAEAVAVPAAVAAEAEGIQAVVVPAAVTTGAAHTKRNGRLTIWQGAAPIFRGRGI